MNIFIYIFVLNYNFIVGSTYHLAIFQLAMYLVISKIFLK